MKSARRDRAKLVAKKINKLVKKTRKTLHFTETLLRRDEKYKYSTLKHIFVYDLGTRKKPEELKQRLEGFDLLISDLEKFTEQYYMRYNAGI